MDKQKLIKNIISILIFLSVLLISLYTTKSILENRMREADRGKICIKENCFSVALAKTNGERNRGLMLVESMGDDQGMLFIFDAPGIYPFWMKDTKIALDIFWILGDKIVYIERAAQPCGQDECPNINPNINADYVLELNGGMAERLNIIEGDTVVISGT